MMKERQKKNESKLEESMKNWLKKTENKLGLSWAKLSSSLDLTLLYFFVNLFFSDPAKIWGKIFQWFPL